MSIGDTTCPHCILNNDNIDVQCAIATSLATIPSKIFHSVTCEACNQESNARAPNRITASLALYNLKPFPDKFSKKLPELKQYLRHIIIEPLPPGPGTYIYDNLRTAGWLMGCNCRGLAETINDLGVNRTKARLKQLAEEFIKKQNSLKNPVKLITLDDAELLLSNLLDRYTE